MNAKRSLEPTFRTLTYPSPPARNRLLRSVLALASCSLLLASACGGGDGTGNTVDPAGSGNTEGSTGSAGNGTNGNGTSGNGTTGNDTTGNSGGNELDAGANTGSGTSGGSSGISNIDFDASFGLPDVVVPLDAVAEPEWDAADQVPPELLGGAFVEKYKSFRIAYPPVLADIYQVLEFLDLLGDGSTRVFGQLVQNEFGVLELRYGSMNVTGSGANVSGEWQDPITENIVAIAPSTEDPLVYASEPFEYWLSLLIDIAGTRYNVQLNTTNALWTARFDESFQTIEEGTLTSVLTQWEADNAPLIGADLFCDLLCIPEKCRRGYPATLAEVLDCRDTKLDSDVDGDGTLDGYQLRIEFQGERVQLNQPSN